MEKRGLFCSLYTDRGSHYWHTPKAGGKVDRGNPTQFGRAMSELGIEMIASYSPEARGRSERFFGRVQGRLPQELALEGITAMEQANVYLNDILCLKEERTVARDNCVSYRGRQLQLPVGHGRHYVKRRVRVHEHADGALSVFHGPRRLATYDPGGAPLSCQVELAAG